MPRASRSRIPKQARSRLRLHDLERFSLVIRYSAMVPLSEEVTMAAAYSVDLRARVLRDARCGCGPVIEGPRGAVHVSRAWVDALKQRRRETGSIAPRKQTTFRARVFAGYRVATGL